MSIPTIALWPIFIGETNFVSGKVAELGDFTAVDLGKSTGVGERLTAVT